MPSRNISGAGKDAGAGDRAALINLFILYKIFILSLFFLCVAYKAGIIFVVDHFVNNNVVNKNQ